MELVQPEKKYFFNISHEVKPGFLSKKTLNRDGQWEYDYYFDACLCMVYEILQFIGKSFELEVFI